jgi:hypothetical protein
MSQNSGSAQFGFVLLLGLAILVVYVSGYYALVTGCDSRWGETAEIVPTYRFGSEWSRILFGPMHLVDRSLRPNYWKEEADRHTIPLWSE